jgi:hypothetical protein
VPVTIKKIAVSDLIVNPENFRYDPVSSQREAIDVMVKEQKENIFELARDIAENGINPNDKIAVAYTGPEKDSPTVLEGNRRSLALKLLDNPNLIENNVKLKGKFEQLHNTFKTKIPQEIEVNVFDDLTEANKWIKLKHTGENKGAGTVGWNAHQTARYKEKIENKSSISLQIFHLLQESPDVPDQLKIRLKDDPKITNFDRMMADPQARAFFGIEVNKNGAVQSSVSKKEVIKGLAQLATDLLDPRFTVGKIYSKENRAKYLNEFDPNKKPNISSKETNPWHLVTTIQTSGPELRPKPQPSERKVVIPKNCSINIGNPKVSNIFTELKKLEVAKYPNAASVLLRVFVELSCDCYIDARKPNINTQRKGNPTLKEKVIGISEDMMKSGFATKDICKGIQTGVGDRHNILSIDTFHNYVHNRFFSPNPENLITAWDNIQEFMTRLWNNLP